MEAKRMTEQKLRDPYDPKRVIVQETIAEKYGVTREYVRRCVVNDLRTDGVKGRMIRKDYDHAMTEITRAIEQVISAVLNQKQAV